MPSAPTETNITMVLSEVGEESRSGKNALVTRYVPMRLTSMVLTYSSVGWSRRVASGPMKPELLIRMSRPEGRRRVSWVTEAVIVCWEVTSMVMWIIVGVGRPAAEAAARTAASVSEAPVREARIRGEAPARAYEMAKARPRPLLAPVMRTDLPRRVVTFVGSMAG